MANIGRFNHSLLNSLLTSLQDAAEEPTVATSNTSSITQWNLTNSDDATNGTNVDVLDTIAGMVTSIDLFKTHDPDVMPCSDIRVSSVEVGTTTEPPGEYVASDESALLYIVIVLGFYAFAMILMMVAYIRRENQEAEMSHYFTEFITRDMFDTARYQNRQKMESVYRTMQAIYKPVVFQETGV